MKEYHFPEITNKSRFFNTPYGYKRKEGDPSTVVPDPEVIPYLKEALEKLDQGNSLRVVVDWLVSKTGIPISHMGLSKIWRRHYQTELTLEGVQTPLQLKRKEEYKEKEKAKKVIKDRAEEVKKKKNRLLGQQKRKVTLAQKRLERMERKLKEGLNKPNIIVPPKIEDYIPQEYNYSVLPDNVEEAEIVFKPNEGPQSDFLAASEREVLYGGAAGGGKSYALIADPLRYFGNKYFNGLLVRRTTEELRDLIWETQQLYPQTYPKARWLEKKSQWVFPSGARMWMSYLERDEDVRRYQGQQFSWIGFDELTQHPTPFAWNYMRSRLRTSRGSGLPLFMRATTNPGGLGHGWVKRMFIDPAPYGKSFWATDIDTGKILVDPQTNKPLFERRFIPAKLADNPYLSEDGQYRLNLLSLPEMQQRQLLEGDWTIAEGAAFKEFRTHIHTCDPYEIPYTWRRFRSCDFGYSSHSAVHWFAIDPQYEQLVVYRELYVSGLTARDLAKAILKEERGENITYGMLDSSCWHTRGQTGPSIAEEMISEGCRWRPSDRTHGARIAGKNRLHELLKVSPQTNKPGIIFFNTCRQIIADLPIIPSDPKGSDDIDDRFSSDHSYDSIRYGIMSRPRAKSPFEDFNDNSYRTHFTPADATFGY